MTKSSEKGEFIWGTAAMGKSSQKEGKGGCESEGGEEKGKHDEGDSEGSNFQLILSEA